jgi:hypothetical protein
MKARWILVWLVWGCVTTAALGDSVERLDMQIDEGTVAEINQEAVVLEIEGQARNIALEDVAAVRFLPDEPAEDAVATPRLMDNVNASVIVLADGSRLAVSGNLNIDGQAGTFTNDVLGQVTVPLEQLAALWLGDGSRSPASLAHACTDLGLDDITTDQLVAIQDDGNLLPVAGILISVETGDEGGEVAFHWADEDRTIELARVRAVLIAGTQLPEESPAGVAVLADGSRVAFTAFTLDKAGAVVLASPILGEMTVTRAQIASVEWSSDRLVYLGELEPSQVTEYGQVLDVHPYRVDRSVSGKPLSLDGAVYDIGLGVHSYAELSWQLDGQYVTFAALAGIDDSVRPRGNATLTLLADGEPLGEAVTLTGEDTAQIVRVDITGVNVLTARVDFGTDELEVSDHVDLVGARLIRVP